MLNPGFDNWYDEWVNIYLFFFKISPPPPPRTLITLPIKCKVDLITCSCQLRKKYTSGPRYWNVPVLVNTGTFLVYQYCLKMWYLRSLEHADVIQKLTILECKNGLVLSNTHVPVSGTSSILSQASNIGVWYKLQLFTPKVNNFICFFGWEVIKSCITTTSISSHYNCVPF